jgi:hypothetical protein
VTTLRNILTTTALIVTASSAATADSVSFSHTTAQQSAPFVDTFSLPNFDTTLGTLDSITITLAFATTVEVDILNATGSPQAFTNAVASTPLTLSAIDGQSLTTESFAGFIDGVAPPGESANPGLTDSGSLTIGPPVSDFTDFEISPSASVNSLTVSAGPSIFNGTAPVGVYFSGSVIAGGVSTITYDYTEPGSSTPEPATMALMSGALLSLGLICRRPTKGSGPALVSAQ